MNQSTAMTQQESEVMIRELSKGLNARVIATRVYHAKYKVF